MDVTEHVQSGPDPLCNLFGQYRTTCESVQMIVMGVRAHVSWVTTSPEYVCRDEWTSDVSQDGI